ncbi:MAG: hypothetical protein ACTHN3_01015 [Solirubrobacterales bacterium]
MSAEQKESGKYSIQFQGDIDQSQVVVGDYNTVSQQIGLSPQETAELRAVFDGLRSAVAEQAPPEQRDAALAEAADLEAAIVTDRPQPQRVRQALAWFRDNAPQLAGAVLSVVVNPLVGKVAEGAGKAIADQFRDLAVQESSSGD